MVPWWRHLDSSGRVSVHFPDNCLSVIIISDGTGGDELGLRVVCQKNGSSEDNVPELTIITHPWTVA